MCWQGSGIVFGQMREVFQIEQNERGDSNKHSVVKRSNSEFSELIIDYWFVAMSSRHIEYGNGRLATWIVYYWYYCKLIKIYIKIWILFVVVLYCLIPLPRKDKIKHELFIIYEKC